MPGGIPTGGGMVVTRRVPDKRVLDDVHILRCDIDYGNITGLLRLPGSSAAITIGATPPTANNAGTGIWIDRTGLYALSANTYQVKILTADGKLYAGGGNCVIDSGGITLKMTSGLLTWLPSGISVMEDIYTISTPSANELQVYGGTLNNVADNVLSIEGFGTVSINTPGYGDGDLRVAGGLYVGESGTDPADNTITADGTITGTQLISNIAIGTAPLAVTSTTKVANLNVDRLDDKDTTTAGAASSIVATDASGNVGYTGALVANKNSTTYSGYAFVPLTSPLTSTSWDGDAYSTAAKTVIDLSAVFSAPAGIKGVRVFVQLRDSGSSTTNPLLILDPADGANTAFVATCAKAEDDGWRYANGIVPCDANGDIYYQTVASGSGTLDIVLQIWGYFI